MSSFELATHLTPKRIFVTAAATSIALAILASCTTQLKPPTSRGDAPRPTLGKVKSPPDPHGWRVHAPSTGKSASYEYPTPELMKLSNGISVYYIGRSSGAVSYRLLVSVGASSDRQETAGLANLAAQVMVEATRRKSHYQLAEATDALGSELNASAGRDHVSLSLQTLPSDAGRGIELMAEALTSPAFNQEDFRRLKEQTLDELRTERQSPSQEAALVGVRLVLGSQLGNPVSGCPESVSRLTVGDVKGWYEQSVSPAKAALFVVGPIARERALQLAEASLGKWRPRPRLVPTPMAEVGATESASHRVYLVDRPGSVQSAIFVAQRFPKHATHGLIARQHLDNVLGGMFTSRINQNLREEHAYTYGARTFVTATKHFGLFSVSTSVEAPVTAPALTEVLKELNAIRGPAAARPIEPAELARSKADLIEGLGAHLADSERVISDLEGLHLHGLPRDYLAKYPDEVKASDLAAVSEASLLLTPQNLTIVVVGDASAISPPLQGAGFQVELAPKDCLMK